jgi:hypothetical protein
MLPRLQKIPLHSLEMRIKSFEPKVWWGSDGTPPHHTTNGFYLILDPWNAIHEADDGRKRKKEYNVTILRTFVLL